MYDTQSSAAEPPKAAQNGPHGDDPRPGHDRGLIRHAGTVGSLALLSRVAGLVRDSVLLHVFGAGMATDAFLMAFIPINAMRKLIADGAMSVGMVPALMGVQGARGTGAAQRLMQLCLGWVLMVSLGLCALAMLAAPWWVPWLAAGFDTWPGKMDLTIALSRWLLPFGVLTLCAGVAGGALNALRRFAVPGASPLCFNVIEIIAMVGLVGLVQPPIMAAVWGVLLGGVGQVILHAGGLLQARWPIRPLAPWRATSQDKTDLSRVLRSSMNGLIVIAAYPINVAIVTALGAQLGEGTVSYIYTADRFFQLPLGVLGIAVAIAALPSLAEAAVGGEAGALRLNDVVAQTARVMAIVTIPASVGLWVLAYPIIGSIMQHGQFDATMAWGTAKVLQAMAPSLVALAGVRLMTQWYAVQGHGRVAIAAAVSSMGITVIIAPGLAVAWGAWGLGCSVSIAVIMQFLLQAWWIRRGTGSASHDVHSDHLRVWRGVIHTIIKSTLASGVMGWVVYMVAQHGNWVQGAVFGNIAWLVLTIVVGVVTYVLCFAAVHKCSISSNVAS